MLRAGCAAVLQEPPHFRCTSVNCPLLDHVILRKPTLGVNLSLSETAVMRGTWSECKKAGRGVRGETHRSNVPWHDAQAQRALLVISSHAGCLIPTLDHDNRVCTPLNIILDAPLCQVVPDRWRRIIDDHLTSNLLGVIVESSWATQSWQLTLCSELL